jgi:acyl-CoA synthetase (AMP-forming)/AMP-acid ligase II
MAFFVVITPQRRHRKAAFVNTAVNTTRPAVTLYPSGRSLTHGQLAQQTAQFANLLQAIGGPDKGGVAFLLRNQIEYPACVLGARAAGFDHLPLNTHASATELIEIISQFGPQMLVVSDSLIDLASQLVPNIPAHVRIVVTGAPRPGWECLDELLNEQATTIVAAEQPGRLLLLSGGSTGKPKIIIRPNAHKANAARSGGALAFLPVDASSTVLLSAPLYHTMPVGWMIGGLDAGGHIVILERWNPVHALEAVQQYGVTLMALVPTMMIGMLEAPNRLGYDVSSIVAVMHGAAPCPIHVKRAFMAWIPPLWEAYGTTEGLIMCQISPEEWLEHPGSVGRPIQDGRVIIRGENGDQLPFGEVGTIYAVRGDQARMSYFGNDQATVVVYNEHGEGTTGDMGYVDPDGYLYLSGRRSGMMIVGGVNVYPTPIEDALLSHPAIQDVGVTSEPHPTLGEVPVAFVQLSPDRKGNDDLRAELRAWYAARANSTGCPRRITFVAEVPRLATGKLDARGLKALANQLTA